MSRFSSTRVRSARLLAGAALVTVAAAGCGAGSTDGAVAGGSGDGRAEVIAAFYPLRWLTERVGGPDVAITELAKPGVEPHDLELTPRQVTSVADADLTVFVRGVQPAVDDAVTQNAPDKGFDAAGVVRTIPATAHDHEHGEEAHGEDAAHAEEAGDAGYDPHIWLDPSRLATVAAKLGERLATADPAHAQGYRDRAAATAADLNALDAEMKKGLGSCSAHAIITSHAAFGYLAGRYGLEQIGISGIDPDSEPAPARLAEVARLAKAENVSTIFTETLVSPKVAEVLASDIGAKTAVLDPLETKPGGGDYLSGMRSNLAALRTALRCS